MEFEMAGVAARHRRGFQGSGSEPTFFPKAWGKFDMDFQALEGTRR